MRGGKKISWIKGGVEERKEGCEKGEVTRRIEEEGMKRANVRVSPAPSLCRAQQAGSPAELSISRRTHRPAGPQGASAPTPLRRHS